MKLVTYSAGGGAAQAGIVIDEQVHPLSGFGLPDSIVGFLKLEEAGMANLAEASKNATGGTPLADVKLLAVIPRPTEHVSAGRQLPIAPHRGWRWQGRQQGRNHAALLHEAADRSDRHRRSDPDSRGVRHGRLRTRDRGGDRQDAPRTSQSRTPISTSPGISSSTMSLRAGSTPWRIASRVRSMASMTG